MQKETATPPLLPKIFPTPIETVVASMSCIWGNNCTSMYMSITIPIMK
eukprot:XP_001705946.1 Hypothetical protein GL50803_36798 [Giardia lamblia ATCC 50803]